MADEKITIKMEVDSKDLDKAVKKSQLGATKLSKTLSKVGSGFKLAMKGGAIAVAGIGAAIIGVVNTAKKFETITTQFKVLTGSAKQAKETVQELQEFAASTPFQFEGISKAAQQLLGFGFSTEELIPKLQEIGDVASAIGKPIEEVGFIFGQVAAAGKLTGERLLQFQERAIPIGPAIAKTMGVAEDSIKDLVSKGKVDFETFQKAFASLSKEGGFAFGGMIQQSKTLGGLLSTVGDNLSLFASDIGQELLPAAKGLANGFLKVIKNIRETDNWFTSAVSRWGKNIEEAFDPVLNAKERIKEIGTEVAKLDKELGVLNRQQEGPKIKWLDELTGASESRVEKIKEFSEQRIALLKELAEKELSIDKETAMRKAEVAKEAETARLEARTEAEVLEDERRAAEQAKIAAHEDAIKKIELTRLKTVQDAKRAIALDDLKAETKENNLRMKEEEKYGKSLAAAKAYFRSEEKKETSQFLDAMTSLSKTGNKELGQIAKVAAIARAIMNTAEGVTKAWSLGPILGPPAAAAVGLAGAAQVATIQSQGFATGGMVEGGMRGVDSVPALLQRGEVVIPPRTSFQDIVDAGRSIAGDSSQNGQSAMVELSFRDNIGEFIEANIIERRALGVSGI